MMNRNSKSLKSSTPRLTTDVVPASYCILSVGQVMRALMKKLPGSLLLSSDMLLNLLQISTLHIQPVWSSFKSLTQAHFTRSSWIPTKVEETSCFHPPVPLFSNSASDPTSTQLFFLGCEPSPDQSHCFCLETWIPLTVQTIFWPAQWSQDF